MQVDCTRVLLYKDIPNRCVENRNFFPSKVSKDMFNNAEMSSQLDFLHDKRKKLHQIDVERSLLKYKSRTSSQRTCYQCGSCFILLSKGLFKQLRTICSSVPCTNAQKIRLSLHVRIVQAIVKKSTQPVIICKFEFIIAKADGAAKSSEVVSYSANGVFFQSVY